MRESAGKLDGRPLFGGVEAGGTKFVCAVGAAPDDIIEHETFPTSAPEETLVDVCAFFRKQMKKYGPLRAIGVGAFGPVDINPLSQTFGRILSTPKAAWRNVDILNRLSDALNCPVAIDTDVNCALYGESRFGAGRDSDNLAYITIGTGVGAGLMINRTIVYGESHPEVGHIFCPKRPEDENFPGSCPFHGDRCFEGLTAGPAIMARWGMSASHLPPDHPGLRTIAHYISLLCLNILLSFSPARIILGGGVMKQSRLYPLVRAALCENLCGYCGARKGLGDFGEFIVPPELGDASGVAGALAIAYDLYVSRKA
ncbi:MAG: ROK family protein [Parvularculaceae bacterium]